MSLELSISFGPAGQASQLKRPSTLGRAAAPAGPWLE